jgi:hypothetical protein
MAVEAVIFQQIVDINWDQAIYTASPNNTINVAQFAAKGSGANIGIALTPKGTGYISAQVPDGTTAGGNARGARAVDWQTSRSAANGVASGESSVIGGGVSNDTINGTYAVVGGGQANGARGVHSFIGGGTFCFAASQYSSVIGGNSSYATAISSTSLGGERTDARRYGQLAHASGQFSAQGDAQWFLHEMRCKTTTNAAVEMFLNGSSTRLVLTANYVLHCRVQIVGSKSDGSAVARYDRQVTIKRVTNTTSLVGSVITLGTDEAAGTSIAITADDTNEALAITATGVTSETWRWLAIVQGAELGIGA